MRGTPGRGLIALATVVGALITPAAASAEVRFASPTGANSGSCTASDPPCSLQWAVETAAQPNDEVVVLPGDYNEGGNSVTPPVAIDLHGVAGQPRPSINYTGSNAAVDIGVSGVLVRDLRILHSGLGGAALSVHAASTVERIIAISSTSTGCSPEFGALIRDSVCQSTAAAGGAAVRLLSGIDVSTATLVNVTAVASAGNSSAIDLEDMDAAQLTLNATNTIASGSGTAADVSAAATMGSVTINLDHSNYDSEFEPGPGTTITDPGSGTNQVATPQFVSIASGDFHQLAGSPTIDSGTSGAPIGDADLDGEGRNQGAAPDIGADEFPVAQPPPPGDNFPPDTKIRKGPKRKTDKHHARFEFGGSEPGVVFECALDGAPFEPCSSPKKLKGLKRGKHVFAVRAIDHAGNADPVPADRKWKITKARKKH